MKALQTLEMLLTIDELTWDDIPAGQNLKPKHI
jgi:hypothetical protein